jgi:IS1 family transposase
VDTLLPGQNGDVLELDELWSFVGRKAEQLWLWVALCRRTRQIVGWTLGDRSLQSACDLRAALAPGYRNRRTRSDFWDAYAAAFSARTHRACGKEEGETNHVERWFGTLRARVGRLVRKAYSLNFIVD